MTSCLPVEPKVLRRDPTGVRADILRIATSEFVANGFGGTRVDEIAARTHTTKRMIYYYFDSKEALFVSVLDRTFDEYWHEESKVDMTGMDPVSAMRYFAEDRFDAYLQNGDFVRLMAIENHRAAARFATRAASRPQGNKNVDVVAAVLEQGIAAGLFRADIDAIDVRMLVVSYSTFRTVFHSTVQTVYGRDMLDPSRLGFYRKLAGDMLVATLTTMPSVDLAT